MKFSKVKNVMIALASAVLLSCKPAYAQEQTVQEVLVVNQPFTITQSKIVDIMLGNVADKYVESVVEYCNTHGNTARESVLMKDIGWTKEEALIFMNQKLDGDMKELKEHALIVEAMYQLDFMGLPVPEQQEAAYNAATKVCYDARTINHPLLKRKTISV